MKNNQIYDAIIVGGGVIGCSIARYLSRFEGKFLVIEKHNDVGDETTNANSAIVHSGYDPLPTTLKAKFNVLGNRMMPKLCEELDVHFIKNGSLTIALSEEELKTLEDLKERAKENGVKATLVNKEELLKMEPNLKDSCLGALLCEDCGIVSPFNLCVSLMENAMNNGAELKLNTKIVSVAKEEGIYVLTDENNEKYYAKTLINATGTYSDKFCSLLEEPEFKIIPRKGQYYVLNHFDNNFLKHTIFMCPTKVGKGVLVSPTTSFNYIIGPSNEDCELDDLSTDKKTLSFVLETSKKFIDFPMQENIRQFSGIRANNDRNDFIIEESKTNSGFYNVAGIMSPGLASSPAIGEYVSNLIKEKLDLKENANYNPCNKKHLSLKKLGTEKYNELIKDDPLFGKVVCRCEKISEGEIIDVIHRNCGAHTVKGVKKRCRPGFGKCQGTFCQSEVINILSRELNIPLEEVCYSDLGSEVFKEKSK